jgi:ribosome-associated heat shock protein Hsp15
MRAYTCERNIGTVRLDKWLWAARFFKSRSLATRACELGRIHLGAQPVKPARDVKIGDRILVKNDSGDFHVEVLGLSEMRGPAAVAQALYSESEESKEARRKAVEMRKSLPFFEQVDGGRPSKRDRRVMDRLRRR